MREPTGAGMCPSTICRPGPMCFVAADSYHSGRFAVLVLPGDLVSGGLAGLPPTRVVPQEVRVVTTGESGFTWSQPATFGDEPVAHITNRPWIAYTSVQQGRNGPTGVLRDSSKSWDVFSLAGGPLAGAGGGDPGRCGVFPP